MIDYLERKRYYFMDQSSLIRLAYIFSDNRSNNFNQNLKLLTMSVLDDNNKGLSLFDIVEEIKTKYGLEFTENEVLSSINIENGKYILNKGKNHTNSKFYISDEGRIKLNGKSNRQFADVTTTFLTEIDSSITSQELESLLLKFIYAVINTNIGELLSLCNYNNVEINVDNANFKQVEFSNEEKDLINKFLYWKSSEKNKLLQRLISFSIDYCMLTVKRNSNNFRQIFKGKNFYLDANVIFRLIGINNKHRKIATNNFIKICQKANVKLYYTADTYTELMESINHHINDLNRKISGLSEITFETAKKFSDCFNTTDDYFYLYYEWKSKNKNLDMDSFRMYLLKQLRECLDNFTVDHRINNSLAFKDETIKQYMSELGKIKYKNLSDYNTSILQIDSRNYLYLSNLRKNEKGDNYLTINNYFITTDNSLIIFDKKINNNIPIVTLPSVWQNILLKLYGRTDDDYASFMEFISLRKNTNYIEEVLQSYILNKLSQLNNTEFSKDDALLKISDVLKANLDSYIDENGINYRAVDELISDATEYAKDENEKRIVQNVTPEIEEKTANDLLNRRVILETNKRLKAYNFIKNLRYLYVIPLLILVIIFSIIIMNTPDVNLEQYIGTFVGIKYVNLSILISLIITIGTLLIQLFSNILFCRGDKKKLKAKMENKYKSQYKLEK